MTDAEAHRRCQVLGLVGHVDRNGWHLLRPSGGAMLARGSSWADVFDRLEQLTRATVEQPAPEREPEQRDLFDWRDEECDLDSREHEEG